MVSTLWDTFWMRDRSGRELWRAGRWLACVLTITATSLTACGDDGRDERTGGRTVAPSAGTHLATAPAEDRESILIKTRINGFAGRVLLGSVIGDARFCAGGTVRHEPGSLEIGFPAVNVFHCPEGQLKIGFGPGPDQAEKSVQTSDWKILGGSGRFAGSSGEGQMVVHFVESGSGKGQEAFRGHIAVP